MPLPKALRASAYTDAAALVVLQNNWKSFTKLRQQVAEEWTALPKAPNVVSEALAEKVAKVRHDKYL